MKKLILFLVICVLFLSLPNENVFPAFVLQLVNVNGNNISSYFANYGVFNYKFTQNSSGFEWPKNSGKYAFNGAGICISSKINGYIAQSTALYNGEYRPGCVINGSGYTSQIFKIYKISRGDNAGNNPDYANWHFMIPYGAPYIDVNNNHQYDQGIDSIGIRSAAQVIFICMTDGFPEGRDPGGTSGFGGGATDPLLLAQVAWTVWCYDRNDLKDIQFMKWAIINKSTSQWNSTYTGIVGDPDLGNKNDDYIGCDTSKKLGYCYNASNYDSVYGANPPAVGIILHKSPKNLTSFTYFNSSSGYPSCEYSTNSALQAYNMMKGYKKDSSNYMNPLVSPPVPTKFVYTGDPETNTGWIESKGSVQNCGGNIGPTINFNQPGNRSILMSSGAENYTVNPNDTIFLYTSQLIARGTSNLNSVTLLKNLANVAWNVYNGGFSVGIKNISSEVPSEYSLYQNYPNPFNPSTIIRFQIKDSRFVSLKVYDILSKEVAVLVNEKLNPGTYEIPFSINHLPRQANNQTTSGIYFYKLTTDGFSETRKMVLMK
jgi:hypothetical protein